MPSSNNNFVESYIEDRKAVAKAFGQLFRVRYDCSQIPDLFALQFVPGTGDDGEDWKGLKFYLYDPNTAHYISVTEEDRPPNNLVLCFVRAICFDQMYDKGRKQMGWSTFPVLRHSKNKMMESCVEMGKALKEIIIEDLLLIVYAYFPAVDAAKKV